MTLIPVLKDKVKAINQGNKMDLDNEEALREQLNTVDETEAKSNPNKNLDLSFNLDINNTTSGVIIKENLDGDAI